MPGIATSAEAMMRHNAISVDTILREARERLQGLATFPSHYIRQKCSKRHARQHLRAVAGGDRGVLCREALRPILRKEISHA